jgi:hypothetical protein
VTSEIEALKSLSGFPIIQAGVAILIILAGVWMVFRGSQDKKPQPTNGVPAWTLYGPVNELMKSIHDMAEQSRKGNETLLRIEGHCMEIRKEQREGTMLLEDIRNNQAMRSEMTIPPSPPRRKSL